MRRHRRAGRRKYWNYWPKSSSRLSDSTGGADKIVKVFFLNLPHRELKAIFREYERRHGKSARRYAEDTFKKWRDGDVSMSGMVAERLFSLIPHSMPAHVKLDVVRCLCTRYGPQAKDFLWIGQEVAASEIIDSVWHHFSKILGNSKIPESLISRFVWMAENDVTAFKKMLDAFQLNQANAAILGFGDRLPDLLWQMLRRDVRTNISHELSFGNCVLTIHFDRYRKGMRFGHPPPYVSIWKRLFG